jgi:hypothetical protein
MLLADLVDEFLDDIKAKFSALLPKSDPRFRRVEFAPFSRCSLRQIFRNQSQHSKKALQT